MHHKVKHKISRMQCDKVVVRLRVHGAAMLLLSVSIMAQCQLRQRPQFHHRQVDRLDLLHRATTTTSTAASMSLPTTIAPLWNGSTAACAVPPRPICFMMGLDFFAVNCETNLMRHQCPRAFGLCSTTSSHHATVPAHLLAREHDRERGVHAHSSGSCIRK